MLKVMAPRGKRNILRTEPESGRFAGGASGA